MANAREVIANCLREQGMDICNQRAIAISAALKLSGLAVVPVEKPMGAIENGREHFRRLSEHYDFECEAGPLRNCQDFIDAEACFDCLAGWIAAAQEPEK